VPLCTPQISHGIARGRTSAFAVRDPATKSQGMASTTKRNWN